MKFLLVGAGYVGSELGRRLVEEGHEVHGARRSSRPLPTGVVAHQVDVVTGAGLASLPRGFDAIVYAVSPGARVEAAYHAVFATGLDRLRSSLPDTRIVLVSSTAVYPQHDGEELDEESPTSSETFGARHLLQGEALALSSPSGTVLRASGIYGPGRTRLVSQLAHGQGSAKERSIWTNRIHRDDLAKALHWTLRQSETGIFLASDPHPAQAGDMADFVQGHPQLHALQRLLPVLPSRPGRRKNRRLLPRRLLQQGFEFGYPSFRQGYSSIFDRLLIDN